MKKIENNYTDKLLYLTADYVFQYDVRCDLIEFLKNANGVLCKYVSLDEFFKIFVLEEEISPKQLVNLKSIKREITTIKDGFTIALKLTNKFGDTFYEFDAVSIIEDAVLSKVVGKISIINDPKTSSSKAFVTDSLTDTLKRDSIIEYAREEIKNNSSPSTLMIVDIDNFSSVNDSYGHLIGDQLLIACANTLKASLEYKGEIGRIGGDKFLIVLKGAYDYKTVWENARRIRSSIEDLVFPSHSEIQLTCTIGIATSPQDGDSFDLVFSKAEKAMLRGKSKGRNCFIIYKEAMHGKVDEGIIVDDLDGKSNSSIITLTNQLFANINNQMLSKEQKINETLEIIGNELALDRILVFKKKDEENIELTASYCSKIYQEFANPTLLYLHTPRAIEESLYNDYLLINNVESFIERNVELGNSLLTRNDKSVVICKMTYNGITKGYVFFEMCSKRRIWLFNESTLLVLATNIISTINL